MNRGWPSPVLVAATGPLSVTNEGGTVSGSSLGELATGSGSYRTLARLTIRGGLGAAALAVPLAASWAARAER